MFGIRVEFSLQFASNHGGRSCLNGMMRRFCLLSKLLVKFAFWNKWWARRWKWSFRWLGCNWILNKFLWSNVAHVVANLVWTTHPAVFRSCVVHRSRSDNSEKLYCGRSVLIWELQASFQDVSKLSRRRHDHGTRYILWWKDFGFNFLWNLAFERIFFRRQHVEAATDWPHICFWWEIWSFKNHFRSWIVNVSTEIVAFHEFLEVERHANVVVFHSLPEQM